MKKVMMIMLFAAGLVVTSCDQSTKKEVNEEVTEIGNDLKDTYNDAKEGIQSAFDDITIPELNDEKAEAYLEEYAAYVKKQTEKGIENIENSEFVKETNEFAEKSEAYLKNLSAEAKVAFKETWAKIDAKAEEIENDLES